ncbi:LMBR1-like membrane protein-domain-containing protein [Lasiosphaeria miniovina]|uniref:LMBR1-like membrane protein-domain-containing protein n=1 Tax=Lasiosphaeria miniovina TaxID=1954250 RepID=A0AA40E0E8_9PEZI|nr:LMBR1-like membrane protein-domain-containing protein [Lasiosphaeria miniovina]KAK0722405.1 LMBR1-like membrane protein-domain-containing protein [Lasiosphaeria miniovina]
MELSTSMSPSPVGSEIFALVVLLAISAVALLILRYYLPLRTTPAFLLVPVFFALWLPASMVLLVPIDLASSAVAEDIDARGIWLEPRALRVSWRITYWLTFSLTWFILPILAEYSDSGYREPKDKVLDSLRSNAQYYAIVFGSGFVGLVYVLISYGHFSESLKSTVMALAYCWGLVLAIYLMGHGLVAIPRRLIRGANVSGRLRAIQSNAPKIYERMEDAEMNLEDLEMIVSELSRRKGGSVSLFQDWVEELVDLTNLPEAQPSRASVLRGSGDAPSVLPTVITEKYMAELTRRLVRAKHARSRYVSEWHRLLRDAVKTQAILDSAASKKLDFGSASPHSGFWEKHTYLTPYTRYVLHYHVVPYFRNTLGAVLALASACIVWSEMVKGVLPSFSIIRYSVVHHWEGDNGQVGLAGQAIAALWMLYMCAAALTSITEVKVWRGRALVRRNTAHESAFWYASQVARLSVPLSYNFMTFLGGIYRNTVFYDFLGQLINLTPLGKWFDYLFPAFILLPICATLFGLYGKVKRIFGFGVDVIDDGDGDDPYSAYGTGSWREGRDLIERELHGTSAVVRGRRAEAAARISGTGVGQGAGAARATPVLSVPRAQRTGPTSPLGTSPNTRPQANTSARRVGAASRGIETDPDDENFFEALGHRFKNTIDTMDTPKWLQDIGQGIKKPKWMGGDDDEGSGSRPRDNNNGNNNSDVRRWFGGSGEGRVRL